MSRIHSLLGTTVGLIGAAWTASAQPLPPGAPPPGFSPLPGMMAPPPSGAPPFPPGMGWAPAQGKPRPPAWPGLANACLERLAHRAAGRAYLKARLDLSPQQLAIWQEVDAISRESDTGERQDCAKLTPEAADTSILQRLDTAEGQAARQLDHLRKISDALRRLTATLSTEQQKLIEQSTPPFPF